MTAAIEDGQVDVQRLIESIQRKLEANRAVLLRSKGYGRLIWRQKKEGFEIKLQPDL